MNTPTKEPRSIGDLLLNDPKISHLVKTAQVQPANQIAQPPEKVISPPPKKPQRLLKQANEITEARFDFTALEMNLFVLVLRTLKQQGEESQYSLYHFDLDSILCMMGDSHSNIEQLKRAAKSISKKDVEIEDRLEDTWTITHLISGMKIVARQRKVWFTIDHFVKPYYFNLVNNFTLVSLESIFAMKSKYAKRIYIMCSRWRDTGLWTVSMEELRERLSIPLDSYTNGGMFKIRVLNIALEEINAASDLNVELVNEWRQGQRNEALEFHIKVKGAESKMKQDPALVDRLRGAGLSEAQIHQIIFFLDKEKINRILYDASLAQANKKIQTTFVAYLVGMFKHSGVTFGT